MVTRKQIRKMKQNRTAKKAVTTSALVLGMGLGVTAVNSNKVDAATWTANSVTSIQSALKSEGTTPYTIKWGDTLSTITEAAKNNGIETSVSRLAEINKIANADLIYAGNKLWFNATNGTVTGTDKKGNNHTYNLNPNKPVVSTPGNSTSSNTGSKTSPAKPTTPNHSTGNGSTTTPSKPGNTGNGNATTPTQPSNPGNNAGGGSTVTPPNNGGTVTPAQKIYTPNADHIKQLLMSKIDMAANGKYWGKPANGVGAAQHLSAQGNGFKSDEDVANELMAGFKDDILIDPTWVSGEITNITVTGSINYTNPKNVTGWVNVSDVSIMWY